MTKRTNKSTKHEADTIIALSKTTSTNEEEDQQILEKERHQDLLIPYLLRHAYHLPGYNWYQDWWQYMTNNHPVLGIFLHHKHHPLNWKIRAISLVGSMLLGLALTNFVYLAFVFVDHDSEQDLLKQQLLQNATLSTGNDQLDQVVGSVSVTTGNLVLWLVGAPIHGIYDSLAWALMGCGCCRFHNNESCWAKFWRTSGAFVVSLSMIGLVCLASFVSLLRAALEADEDIAITLNATELEANTNFNMTDIFGNSTDDMFFNNNNNNNNFTMDQQPTGILDSNFTTSAPKILDSGTTIVIVQDELLTLVQEQDFENYKFVVSFFVELLLSYIIFYPLVGTLFFSGVLATCSNWPIFGGRPYEVQQSKLAKQSALEEEAMEAGVEVELDLPPGTRSHNHLNDRESTKEKVSTREAMTKESQASKSTIKKAADPVKPATKGASKKKQDSTKPSTTHPTKAKIPGNK